MFGNVLDALRERFKLDGRNEIKSGLPKSRI